LWSGVVWAAPEPAAPEPAAPATASSSPNAPGAASTAGAASTDIEANDVAADAAFQRGIELSDRGDLVAALVQYERAYELSPAYQVQYNIGIVSYQLQRWAHARRAFQLYLRLGGPALSPERKEKVNAFITDLSTKTAMWRLTFNVTGAEVHIDGEPVESNEMTGLILDPGEHRVRVSKPGFEPLEQVLHATDGQDMQVVLPLARLNAGEAALPPQSPFGSPSLPRVEMAPADSGRVSLWVPWTVTGMLATGWLTTAALAIKARHDRDIIERPGTPSERIDDAQRLHRTLAIVSDVLLASTLVSGGVSAYLTWWPSSAPNASNVSRSPLDPPAAADGWTLGVFGQF